MDATHPCVLKRASAHPAVLHSNGQPHRVAADGIGDLRHRRRLGKIPSVMRSSKMFEDFFVHHGLRYVQD